MKGLGFEAQGLRHEALGRRRREACPCRGYAAIPRILSLMPKT